MVGQPNVLDSEKWYRNINGDINQALNAAALLGAYTLCDRVSWLRFGNKGSLSVMIDGDRHLIKRYDVIELSAEKHGSTKLAMAKMFADWLVSPEGQQAIGGFHLHEQGLFNPSAASPK
jgi:tungstate transport system substrate-binding protein